MSRTGSRSPTSAFSAHFPVVPTLNHALAPPTQLERMVELRSQQPQEEGSVALADDQIADQVLGAKPEYIQGLGHGVVSLQAELADLTAWRLISLGEGQWMLNLQFKDYNRNKSKRLMTCGKKMDAQREEMKQQRLLLERLVEQLQNGHGGFANT